MASVVVGALSVLAVPAGIVVARQTSVSLLQSSAAAVVGAVLGVSAIIEARRGHERAQMTLGRSGGERGARIGRWLGIVGVLVAGTAALALGFFGLLMLFAS